MNQLNFTIRYDIINLIFIRKSTEIVTFRRHQCWILSFGQVLELLIILIRWDFSISSELCPGEIQTSLLYIYLLLQMFLLQILVHVSLQIILLLLCQLIFLMDLRLLCLLYLPSKQSNIIHDNFHVTLWANVLETQRIPCRWDQRPEVLRRQLYNALRQLTYIFHFRLCPIFERI